MSDEPKNFWWQIWGRPVRFFSALMLLSMVVWLCLDRISRSSNVNILLAVAVFGVFILSTLGLLLSAIPWTLPFVAWILRRWVFCTVLVVTVLALFYAVEDWRGKRAWAQGKRELAAKGVVPEWSAYIPPRVPDEENVFKAPKMAEWFVYTNRARPASELDKRLSNTNTTATITNVTAASNYLQWSAQLEPEFAMVREALKRPASQMDGDYTRPASIPIPNFIAVRELARVLSQRAKCELLLGRPEDALHDVTLMHDMSHLLDAKPTGQPMTLVAAMIHVAITGIYVGTVAEGLRSNAWQEPQLKVLEQQLSEINLMQPVGNAFRSEIVFVPGSVEGASRAELIGLMSLGSTSPNTLFEKIRRPAVLFVSLAPRGWLYQNMAMHARMLSKYFDGFDSTKGIVSPGGLQKSNDALEEKLGRFSPYTRLASITIPAFIKATQTMARQQTGVNEALVAAALERYRTAHGDYPQTLDALVPEFIAKLPHDVIDGEQLKYRRTDGTNFVLYSVGWNEKDDGGVMGKNEADSGHNGDWTWQYWLK